MMGNCKDCRWWVRRPEGKWIGWCKALTDTKIDIGVMIIGAPWRGRGEKVFTADDFGCIQFEARPVGAT